MFDDGDATVYTGAFPILAAAGFPGVAYINSDRIGNAGRLTEAQLLELDAAGWDLANHTATHTDLPTLTEAEQETALATCTAYLEGLGLTRGARHVAFPHGLYNADTLTAMAATGMLTGRGPGETFIVPSSWTPYEWPGTRELSATTTPAQARQWFETVRAGEILPILSHVIDEDGNPGGWTTADFTDLVAYVKAKGCRVVTISQLYDYMQAGCVWPE